MKTRVPRLRFAFTWIASFAGSSLLCITATRAEVMVSLDSTTGLAQSVLIMGAITDDPDPVPNVWQPYHYNQGPLPIVLNPTGHVNGDGNASAVIHPQTRQALVAWAKNGAQGFDIVLSRFSNGTWLAPVTVAGEAVDEVDPVLLADRTTGQLSVIYWIADATPRVVLRTAGADGLSWSAPVQVSAPGDPARRPHAILHDGQAGQLVVVYESVGGGFPSTPRQVVAAHYDGSSFARITIDQTYFSEESWPQVHSKHGRLWVDWIDADGELAWSEHQPAGWTPVSIEQFTGLFDLEFHARGRVAAQVLE